ncbi:uncharacterized protein LOC104425764 [Eucalyptus grandis]|uniref:Uncharacterized protein n=2 Tax=Eucalyptus grandis TaxID=71139 RepID=A0ACC3IVN1_EUCGR|nr:uncharacterized protein LOC104425764 [Eucalyptus grandis]KAK3406003.1 hypothetical protein EUGRSUZ_K02200 [Eucalyptus grandis]
MADPQATTEGQQMNGDRALALAETVGAKRQRRPSVRLGDLGGDLTFDSHVRRKHHSSSSSAAAAAAASASASGNLNRSSKTRPLFNLSSDHHQSLDDNDKFDNLDSVAIGSWKVKDSKKRAPNATKRIRSNWVPKVTDEGGGEVELEKYSGGEDFDDGYNDFDIENLESPVKEQSPVNSLENLGVDSHGNDRDLLYRRPVRGRSRDHHDAVELSGPSDTDLRDRDGRCGEDGVKIWLNGLGLGRYAPVFEVHEVDDEVLPMLTLEDLKDMGINAVGSRRKMYCAIQKLSKGFS